jgi:lipopolysaccharide export system protein LptA
MSFNSKLVFAIFLLAAGSAHSERGDREQPIHYRADMQTGQEDKAGGSKTALLEGNVVITQGSLNVGADRLTVIEDKGAYRLGEATGKPLTFRQKRDDGRGYNEGVAERAEFDERNNTIRFFSNVRLKMGQNEVSGEYVIYNSLTEAYSVVNASPGATAPKRGQIEGIFYPSTDAKSAAPAKATK